MTHEVGIRNSEFGIPTLPPPYLKDVAGLAANPQSAIRKSKFRIWGGWAAFRIPNSEFNGWVGGNDRAE